MDDDAALPPGRRETLKVAAGVSAVAPELPSHGYVITRPVHGSDIPVDLTFVLTRDEPDAIQQKAFDLFMDFFDGHLKR